MVFISADKGWHQPLKVEVGMPLNDLIGITTDWKSVYRGVGYMTSPVRDLTSEWEASHLAEIQQDKHAGGDTPDGRANLCLHDLRHGDPPHIHISARDWSRHLVN